MNKINFGMIGLSAILICIAACKKDLGNYDYTVINKVSFTNIDTVNGYQVSQGDTLHIKPQFEASVDKNLSGSYSYEWKVRNGLFGTSAPDFTEAVLSTSKNLDFVMNFRPGEYGITYSVKDNQTGVTWTQAMKVKVTTSYYEGWLVLSKVSDTSRLDFLALSDDKFTIRQNILATLNPGMATPGSPYQVVFFNSPLFFKGNGVYLLTANGTTLLDAENYRFSKEGDIRNIMLGNVPSGFKAEKMYLSRANPDFYLNILMYANGAVYKSTYGMIEYGAPINTSSTTGRPFTISSQLAASTGFSSRLIFYNEQNKHFYYSWRQDVFSYGAPIEAEPDLNYLTGKDLVYMDDNDVLSNQGTNYTYAVLKDPGAGTFYLMRFPFLNDVPQKADYNEVMNATDIGNANHFAISANLGYLFYSAGGKVYEYDLSLKTSKLMLDKGAERISLLTFDTNILLSRNPKTNDWKNSLMVGSYDPSGITGKNGTLTQYAVQPVNAPLIEQNKWTGMGEVTSVSYRYR